MDFEASLGRSLGEGVTPQFSNEPLRKINCAESAGCALFCFVGCVCAELLCMDDSAGFGVFPVPPELPSCLFGFPIFSGLSHPLSGE